MVRKRPDRALRWTRNCADCAGALASVVKELEVDDFHLVNKPPSGFDMRGCAGSRRCGRCTPQLAAAQHMQADVVGGVLAGGKACGSGSSELPREVDEAVLGLRLFEELW